MNNQLFNAILTTNILPFWGDRMVDMTRGGFYGRIDGRNSLHPHAHKGAVLNTRILWTFSAAYMKFREPTYHRLAKRAFDFINDHFIDKEHGGVYWEVDFAGRPTQSKKQLYAQAFALYGFSEFYRATGDPAALNLSREIFDCMESTADSTHGGYIEGFAEDWSPLLDMRLSTKDINEKKSMNTHLHILEAYTNLYRIDKDLRVAQSLRAMIELFHHRIINSDTHHLSLFFEENWTRKSSTISYGHDIEASWLLREAATVLGDKEVLEATHSLSNKLAIAAIEGFLSDGSMAYERSGNRLDRTRHWWVQAEAVLGFTYAHLHTGSDEFRKIAARIWTYIQRNLIDYKQGEWFWGQTANGVIDHTEDKAGPWKCPYHNSRMCMQMMSLLN